MKAPFPANVCVGGCKALRGQMQSFAWADAKLCIGDCKALRWRLQSFAWTDAKLCVGGCKALRGQLQSFASKMDKTGRKASVLFVIR